MQPRQYNRAPALTLHLGGASPEELNGDELRDRIAEATRTCRALAVTLPAEDRLRRPLRLVADALSVRLAGTEVA